MAIQTCFRNITVEFTPWIREHLLGFDGVNTPGFDSWWHNQIIHSVGQYNKS